MLTFTFDDGLPGWANVFVSAMAFGQTLGGLIEIRRPFIELYLRKCKEVK
jgi:hypothetical protein